MLQTAQEKADLLALFVISWNSTFEDTVIRNELNRAPQITDDEIQWTA